MFDQKYADRIAQILARYPDKRSAVMPMLYVAQDQFGWVSPAALDAVAEVCELNPTQVKSIAGFYSMYSEQPKGKYWLQVCTDLPCALRGADQFYAELNSELGLDHDSGHGSTTADGVFTVEHVTCLAACDKAPMLQCNFHFHESLDMDKMRALIAGWRAALQASGEASEPQGAP